MINCPKSIAIGHRVTIAQGSVLADLTPDLGNSPKIEIGDGTTCLFRFQCNAAVSVKIGSNVLMASNVFITDSDHVVDPKGLPPTRNNLFVSCPVAIGDNCWIGQNAVILKGVTIGDYVVVGANTVVTKSVPSKSVVAGNPGKIIKVL